MRSGVWKRRHASVVFSQSEERHAPVGDEVKELMSFALSAPFARRRRVYTAADTAAALTDFRRQTETGDEYPFEIPDDDELFREIPHPIATVIALPGEERERPWWCACRCGSSKPPVPEDGRESPGVDDRDDMVGFAAPYRVVTQGLPNAADRLASRSVL